MQLKIAILFAIVHVSCTYPYQAPIVSYNPQSRIDYRTGGLAQGYIRYVDAAGTERLVGYGYPEPVYTVHRLRYENQQPFVQPGFVEQTYVYQGGEDQAAREEHFRAWNLQRYQALKTEVDKLYAEGQTPSADLLARLKQLEEMSANGKQAILNETPEVKQAREEHLRLWNEARLKNLQQQQQPILYQQISQAGENIESSQQKVRTEHQQLYNDQLVRISSSEGESQHKHEEASAQVSVTDTPAVQRAKAEHFHLYNEAKKRAEEADKLDAVVVGNLQAPQQSDAELKQLVNSVFQQQPEQVHQAKFLINDQQAQFDNDNTEDERLREQAELEAEQLRERQRLNAEQNRLQFDKAQDAERLRLEQRLMAEERQRLRVEDEKQLRYDLRSQFVEENAQKVGKQFVAPAGVYVLTNKQYEHNPFLFRINTNVGSLIKSTQPTFYSYPGVRTSFAINPSGVQVNPNVLHFSDKSVVPSVKSVQAAESISVNNAQALSELEKATREHFRAHEEALKQLSIANQKSAAAENCN